MASQRAIALASLLGVLLALELALSLFLHTHGTNSRREINKYSYIGQDVPNTLDIPQQSPPVALHIENPQAHYRLAAGDADADNWARLAPGDGRVYLGPSRRPFTLGLFHQMRCLDVVRRAVLSVDPTTGIYNTTGETTTRSCMNYLRQMVLCQANTRLERVTSWYVPPYSRMEQDQVCRDWRVVYDAARRNRREYRAWRRRGGGAGGS